MPGVQKFLKTHFPRFGLLGWPAMMGVLVGKYGSL
jgi:hypothetical protein